MAMGEVFMKYLYWSCFVLLFEVRTVLSRPTGYPY